MSHGFGQLGTHMVLPQTLSHPFQETFRAHVTVTFFPLSSLTLILEPLAGSSC